ncbi:diguanylate cyclase/phosphodiesterase (GGDEF & EAL domains) with PAS/PAC sensor(s) [Alloactinosynnema sp. L-07]|uniref:EAL domain-containing protein n=1 Tax=Alloactinosynnema sp. L-07 TaxID=1653480 RepID=UPI00065F061F|nr:EAL domain-containing protein [Alloactinosynnema sp. L-07]CRK55974.1 diguanylate cyclase/phosphodiesterase (GGDEF & EAL domains) with PAS/PAC sensor(s) [Alloactinosynnema sp. L-07]
MDRAELARRWATALNRVVYVARSRDDIERGLGDLVARLSACLRAGADQSAAVDIGGELVRTGFTRADCLRVSIDVLGPGLSEMEGLPAKRVVPTLAAMAAGFTEGTRDRLFSDQEDIRSAFVRAKENVERDLQASEARFQDVFATSALGMLITDLGGGVVRANEAMEQMLGYKPGTMFRKRLDLIFHPDEARFLRSRYVELVDAEYESVRERTKFLRADGEIAWVRVSVTLLRDRDGIADHHVTMVEDVSDLHLIEQKLSFQTTHDLLTGLSNRQSFESKLEELLAGGQVTVFHIGLDDLVGVNTGLGRDAGDRLLQVSTSRLKSIIGADAILARLAGDEFAFVVRGIPDVAALAAEVNDSLAEATYVDGQGIASTATVAVYPAPASTDPADVLRATETTLRRLRGQGRRQWGLVDATVDDPLRAQSRLAAAIPGAWENGELEVDYQPVVDLCSGELVAVQALLRWDSPVHGKFTHSCCREILADSGLGVHVDQWALGAAAERLTDWPKAPRLYVDLSSELSADPDLVRTVRRALTPEGVTLGFPIAALADSQAEDNLDVLIDLGIQLVLTDFGAARGDLAAVEDYPVHGVRLAESVVARVGVAPDPKSLFVRSLVDLIPMVRSAGRTVLVGSVDTAAQAEWWAAAGADLAVGTHFGRPDSLANLLA